VGFSFILGGRAKSIQRTVDEHADKALGLEGGN
jgi:hypothetical protein